LFSVPLKGKPKKILKLGDLCVFAVNTINNKYLEAAMGMKELTEELYARREKAKQMGGEQKVRAQHERGRLTARERVDKLLDPDSFWEVGLLNRSDEPGMAELTPADGRICGVGKIDGRKVVVVAEDRTVLGGSGGRVGRFKKEEIRAMAAEKGYPIIGLGDEAGGVRLPDTMGSFGMLRLARDQKHCGLMFPLPRRVPRIEAIMGECFGEPSWNAAWSDFVVMVKGTAMGAAGPRIIEYAIGEKVTPQEMCGWEIQAELTGQVDAFAEDEEECLAIVKKYLSYMPSHTEEEPPFLPTRDDPYRRLEDLDKIVPDRYDRGYDMYRLIELIVDDGDYFSLKREYAESIITSLARIGGRVVGIIANNPWYDAGAPNVPAIEKATSFICLCDSFNIPLIFLTDIPGMFPGTASEKLKLPTKIVVMVEAIGLATVPKICIVIRKAYGIGFQCMGAGQEDIHAAWPTASISFVDTLTGVELVYGRKIAESQNLEEERARLIEEWGVQSAPWGGASVSCLEVIDPKDTRKFIYKSLDVIRGNRGKCIGQHHLANWPTGF